MSVPILATAAPASAAGAGITSPDDGAVISSGGSVKVAATTEWLNAWRLVVVSPGGTEQVVASKGALSSAGLSGTADLGNNGRYEVRLQENFLGWHTKATRSFVARVPPAAPGGVSAKLSGSKITVRWNRGLESDLLGYSISAGAAGSKSGSVDGLCSGTSCSTTFAVPSSASGTIPVRVRARRSDGSGGSIYSSAASASVTVKGSGGSGGGGSSVSPPSSSVPPTVPSTPPPGAAPLTPFNNASPVTLPQVQPEGATPGLTYPAPQVADQNRPKAQNVAASDTLQWGKSIATALILLLIAAHLGTWTRRIRVAHAGVSSQGTAARIARSGTGRKRVIRARQQIAQAEAAARTAEISSAVKAARGERGSKAAAAPSRPGASRAGRRPATLGGGNSGVVVRIAEPAHRSGARHGARRRRGGRRRAK
ncbi:hypothetical protein [Actinomadura rubrobrunea]|nr:hypothetical protein [Actinomadura rubrobrunea]